ncbi:Interferon-induced, double-stranded RNA-activated protein kinase [Channa argus]|uniref:Interferon-induced, double-stranded RNA-activated protein kinase n=1 Tax=Channa argus TaxID=215402 RepID=A0A6G1R1S2_CHAAH|nr:Interferon-induced, double-stranded RNA-activated protein kinase [Channa argus]
MGKKKYTTKLKAHARKAGLEVKYQTVSGEEGSGKRFMIRTLINGEYFSIGEGKNHQEAKQNAAKNTLRCLSEKENQRPVTEHVAKRITKSSDVGLLREYCEKNNVPMKAVEPPKMKTNNATTFVVGDTPHPHPVRGAKEEKAKLVFHEVCGTKTTQVSSCSAVSEDGTEAKLSGSSSRHKKSEFDFLEKLGNGAFGRVFKARHTLLNNYYAIKIVPCTEKDKALREVKALSDLDHSNIVRYYSCWMEDTGHEWDGSDDSCSSSPSNTTSCEEYLYIQMALCDTKTLEVWIDEMNAQSVKKSLHKRREESLTIAQQIVSGVEYIHSKKFIHRDLKPANIMFGENKKVKIGDFGLVTTENDHNDENLMERTACKGTPSYMAPEQKSEKDYDRKVDIFALGLIYFELLWKLSTAHEKQMYIIINSMLSVKPEDRPEASKLVVDLDECKGLFISLHNQRRSSRTV